MLSMILFCLLLPFSLVTTSSPASASAHLPVKKAILTDFSRENVSSVISTPKLQTITNNVQTISSRKNKTSRKKRVHTKNQIPPQSATVEAPSNQVQRLQRQTNLSPQILKLAFAAYNKVNRKGLVNKPYLTVIDYSLPSSQKRMWVIDVNRTAVMFHTYVAHGKNSGDLHSTSFSNKSGSKASSLGTFITSDTYHGSVGYALNLKGLEKGINDNALSRRVVIHGADYVSQAFLSRHGRLGRSWGCPALEKAIAPKVINQIKGGSVVFAYYPHKNWLSSSALLAA